MSLLKNSLNLKLCKCWSTFSFANKTWITQSGLSHHLEIVELCSVEFQGSIHKEFLRVSLEESVSTAIWQRIRESCFLTAGTVTSSTGCSQHLAQFLHLVEAPLMFIELNRIWVNQKLPESCIPCMNSNSPHLTLVQKNFFDILLYTKNCVIPGSLLLKSLPSNW